MASQMHITELKESQIRTISDKDKEIELLQTKIEQFKINVDENTALRTQVSNDF